MELGKWGMLALLRMQWGHVVRVKSFCTYKKLLSARFMHERLRAAGNHPNFHRKQLARADPT